MNKWIGRYTHTPKNSLGESYIMCHPEHGSVRKNILRSVFFAQIFKF